jgi:hypothetical protein
MNIQGDLFTLSYWVYIQNLRFPARSMKTKGLLRRYPRKGNYPLTVGIGNLHTSGWFLPYPYGTICPEDDMPAIPQEILDTVVYLYPDADSARRGERAGGSGCVVVLPTQTEPFIVGFMYIVTNSHVIREGKASAIRLNTRDKSLGIIDGTASGWIHHPDGDDLAVLPISLEYERIKAKGITPDWFVTKEKIERYKIGPGDEAFMVGRFINHEGKQQNLPAIRFGNLSMLPFEPVRTNRGLLQEAFLVECRSLPGYSGSPVFLYPLPSSPIPREAVPPMFLGIDMGHLTDKRPVLDKAELLNGKRVPIDDNWVVETNTGMSCVIPAWKLLELLYVEELVESRKQVLQEMENAKINSAVSFDIAEPERPSFTQADFEAALKKVSRKITPKM